MDRHIESFLEMLSAERGAARNTIAAYTADLQALAGFLGARGVAPGAATAAALGDIRNRQDGKRSERSLTATRVRRIRDLKRLSLFAS